MHRHPNLRSKIINYIIFIVMTVCMIYTSVVTLSLFTQSKANAKAVNVSPVVKMDNNSVTRFFNFKYKQQIEVEYKSLKRTVTFQSDSLNKDGSLDTIGAISPGDDVPLYYSCILNSLRTRGPSVFDGIYFIIIFSVYILYIKKISERRVS